MAETPGWDCHVHVFDAAAPVLDGHYTPATRTLQEIEDLARPHGIRHLVLVQPSVYGGDNSVLLRALRVQPGRHRGVAVVDAQITDAQLDAMHAAGVRGVRFNLVSPVGNDETALPRLADRLRERSWHVQWYVAAHQLASLVEQQRRTHLVFVLDHFGGLNAHAPVPEAHWHALAELAAQGAWLKLSGWYRLGVDPPYTQVEPLIRRAGQIFGDRLVWGSDWPHTSLPPSCASRHESLLQPVRAALGESADAVLRTHPLELYGES